LYIGIAKNTEGFRELNELMTESNRAKTPLPEKAPEFQQAFVVYPFGKIKPESLGENEFIGIKARQLNKIIFAPGKDLEKYVMLHPVSFGKRDYKLHRQLRAIDHNLLISQLQPEQFA